MKKHFLFLTLLLLTHFFTATAQIAPNNRLLFTVDLNGQQEVPSVTTEARGIVTILLSADRTTMSVHGVFSGLSGPITGCHIHDGAPGVNGAVLVHFTPDIDGNRLRSEIPVPAGILAKALKNQLYLNVHTTLNPGGEIRGQLELMNENLYRTVLNGANEVPAVNTPAVGVGMLAHSPGNFFLRYQIVVNGLSGPITAAHIHDGAAGVSGPVVVPLTVGLPNVLSGSLQLTALPIDFLQKLEEGKLYVNVHTAAHPAGEIRGQLLVPGPIAFEAFLNGDQETPAVTSSASGIAIAALNPSLDSITYHVLATGLTPTAAHFHSGVAGVAGPVLLGLQTTSTPNYYTAKVAVVDSVVSKFLNSGLYVNVHTAAHPAGEIRGQAEPLLRRAYAFDLCGEQEAPPTNSTGQGAAYVTTDRLNTHLNYRYIVDGLTGTATAAHFHEGAPGVSGPVYIGVNLPNPLVGSGQFQITGNDVEKLESGNVYLNVHTMAHQAGEIRGQVLREVSCSVNVGTQEPVIGESRVFPNPTNSEATLQLHVNEAFDGQLAITDLNGKIIRQEAHAFFSGDQTLRIQLGNVPAGLYLASIRSATDGIVWTSRVVRY